jgi:hypothetical protein
MDTTGLATKRDALSAMTSAGAWSWLSFPRLTRLDRAILVGLLVYAAVLVGLAFRLSPERFAFTFSEEGPFEEASIFLWLGAGAMIVWFVRPFTVRSAAFALLFVAFAAREASWHKLFTADSLLKISYYLKSPAPLTEKFIAGAAAAIFIAMLLYVAYVVARFIFAEGGLSSRAGYWLVLAGAVFVLSKIIDRAPSVIFDLAGHTLDIDVRRVMKAFEEGFEAVTPALFALSAWVGGKNRSYLS